MTLINNNRRLSNQLQILKIQYDWKFIILFFSAQFQACRGVFQHAATKSGRDFMISVSYLEIRDEKMTDLLNPHNNNMTIKEHPTKGM